MAISTEGYIAIYDIEELLESLSSLEGKIMDLEGEFDSIYRFDIDSRLIALGSRLNFLKVESSANQTQPKNSKIANGLKKIQNQAQETESEDEDEEEEGEEEDRGENYKPKPEQNN